MRRPLVIGNWKMNGTSESSRKLLNSVRQKVEQKALECDVGVCIPFVFIPLGQKVLGGSPILLGSQNVADQPSGAFTGEVSAGMLKEFGCSMAIVGHSERRALYGESDELVAARFKRAIEEGLVPVLCVGETLEQREGGETFNTVMRQLEAVLKISGIGSLADAVIAYEPVWAIGTGKTATSQQAREVHGFIRDRLADLDGEVADRVRILYGGSVKPDNAAELFSMPDIDGGLIGGASLDAESFLNICYSV